MVILEEPGANLGTLQVLQNADGAILLLGGAPQAFDVARVILMRPVGEVQPGNIHAEAHEIAQHGLGMARRPNGADNLGATDGRSGLRHLLYRFVQFPRN